MLSLLALFVVLNMFFGLLGFLFKLSWRLLRLMLGLLMGIGTYVLVFVFAVPLLVVVPVILIVFLLLKGMFRILF